MAAYMKHRGRFLGVNKPPRAAAQRALFAAHRLEDRETFRATVAAIWDRAEYREERYLALDLLGLKRHAKWLDADTLPLIERLIVEGGWWDPLDACVGPLGIVVRSAPEALVPEMRAWAAGPNLWTRRAAVLFQLKAKAEADFALMTELIEIALAAPGLKSDLDPKDERFFVRKAAGWALRQHARLDPDAVRSGPGWRPDPSCPASPDARR